MPPKIPEVCTKKFFSVDQCCSVSRKIRRQSEIKQLKKETRLWTDWWLSNLQNAENNARISPESASFMQSCHNTLVLLWSTVQCLIWNDSRGKTKERVNRQCLRCRSSLITTTLVLLLGKPIQVHTISGKGLALFLLVSAELRWYFEKLKGKNRFPNRTPSRSGQLFMEKSWNGFFPEKPQCKRRVQGLHCMIDRSQTSANDHLPRMIGNMISLLDSGTKLYRG